MGAQPPVGEPVRDAYGKQHDHQSGNYGNPKLSHDAISLLLDLVLTNHVGPAAYPSEDEANVHETELRTGWDWRSPAGGRQR